jgi:hypothetical protein
VPTGQAVSPPVGQSTIISKVSIASTLSNEEQGARFLEEEWTPGGFLVGFCRGIGTSHQADSRDGHLSRERAFYLMVAGSLQRENV